jgi:hypothetical protein
MGNRSVAERLPAKVIKQKKRKRNCIDRLAQRINFMGATITSAFQEATDCPAIIVAPAMMQQGILTWGIRKKPVSLNSTAHLLSG